ncbi:MAG: type transporter [Phycisphaerales bacterium]|nr:type transporter [Phycisphaerales bacterium]
MRGFLHHLLLTLKLNFRNPQAVVFGYVVPIFFLFAYGSVFASRSTGAPLTRQLGQLLTISVLGGACFGMPIAFVSERERGVWRRYRLTPMPTVAFAASVLIARFIIVVTAAVLQIALALWIYKMPFPKYPWHLALAFTFVCFAFLGIGLVISMIANSTHAVQALGQSLFLPMIIIGGVGVPLDMLPDWAKHVATFLPGRYAVQALDACVMDFAATSTLYGPYNLIALVAIGVASTFAAAKLFRWENNQKLPRRGMVWIVLSLATWAAVGLVAEKYHLAIPAKKEPAKAAPSVIKKTPAASRPTSRTPE